MFKLKIFISLFLLFFSYLPAEEINLKISLKNGTTGGIGKADTIKLIALQGGMVPIGEFQNKQGDFVLEKINFPDEAPVLIQVSYKGANYNKMVPPAPMFRTKVQEITVYEVTSEFKGKVEVESKEGSNVEIDLDKKGGSIKVEDGDNKIDVKVKDDNKK